MQVAVPTKHLAALFAAVEGAVGKTVGISAMPAQDPA
jgi:hypothetical protein